MLCLPRDLLGLSKNRRLQRIPTVDHGLFHPFTKIALFLSRTQPKSIRKPHSGKTHLVLENQIAHRSNSREPELNGLVHLSARSGTWR
eukprot:s255_g6.t1